MPYPPPGKRDKVKERPITLKTEPFYTTEIGG